MNVSPLDAEQMDGHEDDPERPDYFDPALYAAGSAAQAGEQHRGQLRIAYRLAASHADRLMYVNGLGWHTWDGRRWAKDEKAAAENAVLAVLRDGK